MNTRLPRLLLMLTAAALIPAVISCSAQNKGDRPSAPAISKRQSLHTAISDLAGRVDRGLEDGWVVGRDPRIFKSGYRKAPPAVKADFALAYHQFVGESGQDLEKDTKTYIPYARRAAFARQWWTERDPDFAHQTKKMQVVWMHEALLDAGELWWRAHETASGEKVTTGQVMAHDVEQDMVSKYMEDENTPGSLSTQLY